MLAGIETMVAVPLKREALAQRRAFYTAVRHRVDRQTTRENRLVLPFACSPR